MEAAEGFETFVSIVDAGSISAAARDGHAPRETLSRQLARLEARLGARLIHRGPRALVLTPAGELLYARARPLVIAAREAAAAIRDLDEVPAGLLRVSVPPGTGGPFLGTMCARFVERYPQVELEVFATSRYVDLVAEGVDVALRAGLGKDPGLLTRTIWSSEVSAVASPEYLQRAGRPMELDDLSRHDCLRGMSGAMKPNNHWPLRDGGSVAVKGRLTSNDLGVLLAAAEAGQGIALLPGPFTQPGLSAGRLEAILPGVLGPTTAMRLVFLERRLMPAKVRAFIDFTVDAFVEGAGDALSAAMGGQAEG
jgi:LysR family transcriptional regulator for bpeEF and oprC